MTQNNCEIIPVNLGMVNAFLLKRADGKAILIDCGVPGSDKAILQAMSDAGIQNKDLELIIITHGHTDHMGASSVLRDATGAKTMIHTLDADIIRTGKSPKLYPINTTGRIFNFFNKLGSGMIKGFQPYEPELVIEGETSLHEFGVDGKIIETPGHTEGSISVLLDDGSAFVGDLIMGGMFGKGNPGLPMHVKNMEEEKNSIQKVLSLSPKIIYTGHGGPFTINEITNSIKI
jgi:hydroxyacylglutathione hydrolase